MERTFLDAQRENLFKAFQESAFKGYPTIKGYLEDQSVYTITTDLVKHLNNLGYTISPGTCSNETRKTSTKVNIDGKHYDIISTIEIRPSVNYRPLKRAACEE